MNLNFALICKILIILYQSRIYYSLLCSYQCSVFMLLFTQLSSGHPYTNKCSTTKLQHVFTLFVHTQYATTTTTHIEYFIRPNVIVTISVQGHVRVVMGKCLRCCQSACKFLHNKVMHYYDDDG